MGTSLGTPAVSDSVIALPTVVPGVTLFRNDVNTLPLCAPAASLEASLEAIHDDTETGPEGWRNMPPDFHGNSSEKLPASRFAAGCRSRVKHWADTSERLPSTLPSEAVRPFSEAAGITPDTLP